MSAKDKYIYDEIECSYNVDFVKCPYCGFEDHDVYDGLDIDATEYDCPNCGKTFGFSAEQIGFGAEQIVEFTSFPLEDGDKE